MKKILFSIVFLLLFFGFMYAPRVSAITDTPGDLQVTYDDPLFPPSIVWYPGLSVTKSITVKNVGASTHTVSIKADNTSQTGNIDQLYLFKITEGSASWYGGSNDKTMKNFWDTGELHLSDLSPGSEATYDITITMPSSAGNEYQDKEAKFDLIIGFVGTNETVTVSGGGGGGGTVTGVAAGFAPGVLGLSTPEAKLITPGSRKGEIKGAETTVAVCTDCIWWQLILTEVIALLLYDAVIYLIISLIYRK